MVDTPEVQIEDFDPDNPDHIALTTLPNVCANANENNESYSTVEGETDGN